MMANFVVPLFSTSSPACGSHQQTLGHRHGQDEGVSCQRYQQDLAEELIQPDPALAGKGPPCSHEVHVALAGNNRRLDSAAKGTVKGHDGVLIRREQGRLHANKNSVGRDNEQQHAKDENDERKQRFPDNLEIRTDAEQTQGAGEREDKESGKLARGPVDAHGDPGGLEGFAEGRQAVDEA